VVVIIVVRFINKWLSIIQRHREIEGAGRVDLLISEMKPFGLSLKPIPVLP
jgi:hypothetical protein